ncbi:MAG: hypothetical protein SOV24_00845 [Muribaculaceae bacterium]|nr:hypothetical protein [Muribaculaceae bacterium]MCI6494368.1 hypothetical protein [Bacteroidales bacterium]MDD6701765.1 hypothetical protein [Bacteroidales bacterium]MDD6942762.1 hypothetical protein [Bacteroidales bacterium]MDY2732903.1 hypothetical protein [Muribaculaceae bacterium]
MKKSTLFGFIVLALVYIWLAWLILSKSSVTLYNILLIVMAGMIIFVPLYRKYMVKEDKNRKK